MSQLQEDTMSDTPIWDVLVREMYAERARAAYAASPDMIGCGQWELPPEGDIPGMRRRRRERGPEWRRRERENVAKLKRLDP